MLLAASGAVADDTVFGAWTVRCEKVDDATAQACIMQQNLVLKGGGQPVLQFTLGIAPGDEGPTVVLKVPLGIYLPPGLSLQIDQAAPTVLPLETCDPDGCQAVIKLRAQTLAALRGGRGLTVTFHDAERRPLSMPLSLDGFSAAFDALAASGQQ